MRRILDVPADLRGDYSHGNGELPQTGDTDDTEAPGPDDFTEAEIVDLEEVLPPGPAHYLPDVVSEDAGENLRTQALHWYEQGRVVLQLLDDGVTVEPLV